jgi:hypothetical protein
MGIRRRKFLKSGAATTTAVGAAGLSGCSALAGGSETLKLAYQAPAETVDINTWYAAKGIAPREYDLDPEVSVFEGVDLAVQSVLADEAHLARGSVTAAATIVDAGKDFEFVFAPVHSTDYVLVTRPEITSLEQIVEQDAVIGMSAPTGLDAVQMAALMFEKGVIDNVDELNFQRVGYSGARKSAILEGSIDVSPQHYAQWLTMKGEESDLNRLAAFGDVLDKWIQETFLVPSKTVEDRREQLVDFLAAQLLADRRLYGDYERYRGLVEEHVEGGGPSDEILQKTYQFVTDIDIWPPDGGLTQENVDYMLDLSNRVGLTDTRIPTDQVLNRGPLGDALERVGEA